jgi:hypothetical protein
MSGSRRHRLRHAVRSFLLGSGPLKRNSDRLQMTSRLLVVLSLLAAVPVGFVVSGITRGNLQGTAAAQAAERHEVRAVVVEHTALSPAAAGDTPAPFSVTRAQVSWRGPHDALRHGHLLLPAGTAVGSTVPIWLDRSGALTTAPADRVTISDDAVIVGLAVAVGVPLSLWALHCGLCIALDAHRTRRWGADWARVEREWRARSG